MTDITTNLAEALELIAATDPIEAALDPQRAIRVAREALAQYEQAKPAEPVAWRTFDGEGGYDYRTYTDNEDYAAEWAKRNPKHVGWVEPLFAAPRSTGRAIHRRATHAPLQQPAAVDPDGRSKPLRVRPNCPRHRNRPRHQGETMNENQEREALPPLPEPDYEHPCGAPYFTPDQMHAYARVAQQAARVPLTDEQFDRLFACFGISPVRFSRAIEAACAEAWGVKLAGIGASTKESNQ